MRKFYNLFSNLLTKGTKNQNEKANKASNNMGTFVSFIAVIMLTILGSMSIQAQSVLIDPAGDGGFETGTTLTANGWTAVNNATNAWNVGTATFSAGTKSAYISSSGGTVYSYGNTTSAVSHFYRDITVPAGQSAITLSFKLKGDGDVAGGIYYDKLMVYTAPTTFTPVTSSPVSSGTTLTDATLAYAQAANYGSAYNSITVVLPASLAGTTFRLIFTWHNDSSLGTVPSSVDEISLISTVPSPSICPTLTPLTGATGASSSTVLSWSNAGGAPAPTYNVFFSSNPALVTVMDSSVRVLTATSNTTYSPALVPGTTYYWMVVPINPSGAPTSCTVNSFTVALPSTYTATATGGLWSSAATWVGGFVPVAGNDVTIPSGSVVTVDQAVTLRNIDVSGIMQWSGTSALTLTGSLTVNSGGSFLPYSTSLTGATLNIAGNFTNNGYANLAAASTILNFNGTGSTLSGTGVFEGDGTRGIIRALYSTSGANTISTTQDLTVSSEIRTLAGSLATNGKLKLDNTAQVYGQSINLKVANVAVTNMGSLYGTAPVVFGTAVTQWSSVTGTVGTRYVSGNNVYVCTGANIGATAPTHTGTTVVDNLLWIGNVGTLGNPFITSALTVGTQYFYGGNLYTAVDITAAGTTPPTHITGIVGSFLYVGTPATATVNYDATTQTVRSLNLTSAGVGYSSAPSVTFSIGAVGDLGSGAAATSVYIQKIDGPANSAVLKDPAASVTGGLTINNNQAASSFSGVGNISAGNGGVNYTVPPTVGFAGPTAINLVTSSGSAYASAPTVTVTGGTLISGTGLGSANFTVVIAQGKVVSTYLNASTTAVYSVPPTLAFSSGTATLAFPAGCWPTATASIGTNGQITNFTITNPGFGYVTAPTVGVGTTTATAAGGTFKTVASTFAARLALYNLTIGQGTVSTVVNNEGFEIPTNRKINALTMNGPKGSVFTSDLRLFAASSAITLTSGVVDLGSNTLFFEHPAYAGVTGSLTSSVNGKMQLNTPGGSLTRTFPFNGPVAVATGTGSNATTGSTVTSLTASITAAPTGIVNTLGTTPTGARSFRIQTNAGAVYGTAPTVQLNYIPNDAITSDAPSLFVAQSAATTGAWTIRSATSGTVGALLPTSGLRTTATTGSGPIVPTGDDYFAWVSTLTTAYQSAQTGDWSATSTWVGGVIPPTGACADVYINNGHNVTVSTTGNFSKNLIINTGGTLTIASGDLTVGCTNNNNIFNNYGTLTVTGGTLNVNGNTNHVLGSYFNQSGGNINSDGNAAGVTANSVASLTHIVLIATSNLSLTGGMLTIVDPHAASSTTSYSFSYNGPAAVDNTVGWSLRFGNGTSTDAGGTTATSGAGGFIWHNSAVAANKMYFDNIIINGGIGTNRNVYNASTTIGVKDLTINANSEFCMATSGISISGNFTNNGIFTHTAATLSFQDFKSNTASASTNAQVISGTGLFRTSKTLYNSTAGATSVGNTVTVVSTTSLAVGQFVIVTAGVGAFAPGTYVTSIVNSTSFTTNVAPTTDLSGGASIVSAFEANLRSVTFNNSNATGITINVPLFVSGTLTMTSGIINTSSSSLLTLGTLNAAGTLSPSSLITAGTASATNMIRGPFARTFAINRTATGTYDTTTLFPVGKGSLYLPMWIDPTTAATGIAGVTMSTEALTANGGSSGAGVSNLSANNWNTKAAYGSANLTSARIQVSDASTILPSSTFKLVQSATETGAFEGALGGSSITSTNIAVGTNVVAQSNLTSLSGLTGTPMYYAYANLISCVAPVDQATLAVNSNVTNTTFTGSYTAATSAPTGYLVVRYASGATATAPSDFSLYASGAALGTGTVVYFGTATTFNVTGLAPSTTYDYYVYSYNNSGCAGPAYNTTSPLYGTVTTCAAATGPASALVYSGATPTGFTAAWTASATTGVTYSIDVATNNTFTTFVPGYQGYDAGTALTTTVSGLSAATVYYVRVRALLGGSCPSANTATMTVTTPCNAVSIPYTEGFESITAANTLPACMTVSPAIGGKTRTYIATQSNAALIARTGTKFGAVYWSPSATTGYFFSAPLQLTGGVSYTAKVFYKTDGVAWTTAALSWGADATAAAMTTTIASVGDASETSYTELSGAFTPTVSGVYYVAFSGYNATTSPNYIAFDDFSVTLTPTCFAPNAITATAITNNSATIGWSAPAQGTPVSYDYEVRTSGTPGSGATGLVASATLASTVLTANLSGLTAQTTYSVYVRTFCGGTDYSAWSDASNFATLCDAIATFTFTESFDLTSSTLGCWGISSAGTANWGINTADAAHGASAPSSSTYFAYLDVYNAISSGNTYNLFTPTFTLNTTPKEFTYNYFLGSGGYNGSNPSVPSTDFSYNPYPLEVLVSVNGGAYTSIYQHSSLNTTFATSSTSPWQTNTIDLTPYMGQNVQFKFQSNSNYGSGTCNQGLDQVKVRNIPPVITSFTPNAVCDGANTPVVITGTAFSGATAVSLNGVAATSFTVDSATQITAVFPALATTGTISITTPGDTGTSATSLTVNPYPVVPAIAGGNELCLPNTLTLTNTTTGGVWSTLDTNIATIDATSGVVTGVSAGSATIKYTKTTNACSTDVSTSVTVNAPPAIVSYTTSQTILFGTNTTFSVSATGTGLTYAWQVSTDAGATYSPVVDNSLYGGASTSTLTMTAVNISNNGNLYKCIVSGVGSCTPPAVSTAALLIVGDTGISTHPQPVSLCSTGTGTTTFSVTGAGSIVSYNWQISSGGAYTTIANGTVGNLTFSDATTATLTVSGILPTDNGLLFRAIVNGTTINATSNSALLTVNTQPVVATSPTDQTVCYSGGTANFTGSFTGTVSGYNWLYSTDGLSWASVANGTPAGVTYTGAATASLSVTNSITTPVAVYYYKVEAIAATSCSNVSSQSAQLLINNPTITVQPANSSATAGATGTISVTATAVSPTYQWQYSSTLGGTYANIVDGIPGIISYTGTTTSTLSVIVSQSAAAGNSNYYRVIITSNGCSVTSTPSQFSIFVYCTPAPTSVDGTGITNVTVGSINNTTVAETGNYGDYTSMSTDVIQGSAVPFSVQFSTGYDYLTKIWIDFNKDGDFTDSGEEVYSGGNPDESNPPIPSALTGSLTIPLSAPLGTTRMRIGGTDSGPTTPCYNSFYGSYEDYSVNILQAPPCTGAPIAGVIASTTPVLCYTGTSTLTLSGYTNDVTGVNIQWEKTTDGLVWTPIAGANTAELSTGTITQETVYRAVLTCVNGNVSSTTDPFTVSVFSPSVVSVVNGNRCGTGTVSLSAVMANADTMNWYTAPTGGTAIGTGSSFVTPSISATTTYYVEAKNNICSSVRTAVVANVATPPALTLSSNAATICESLSTDLITIDSGLNDYDTFDLTPSDYTGDPYSGFNLNPAITTTYTLTSQSFSGLNCANTASFTVTVNPRPTVISISPSPASICVNTITPLVTSGGTVVTNPLVTTMDVLPSNFTVSGTNATATLNTTYYSQGTGSVYLNTTGTSARYQMNSNIDLSGAQSATLTFSHIAAMEGDFSSFDYGYVLYSIDGGLNWINLTPANYVGTAATSVFDNSATTPRARFSTLSYPDWTTQFTLDTDTPGTGPATSLWKTETFNIPASALNSNQFRIQFRYSLDSSVNYYGWLIDDVKINKVSTASMVWSPTTNLYSDATATTAYASQSAGTVYTNSSSPTTNTYTTTATSGAGCKRTQTVDVTVNPDTTLTWTSGSATPTTCINNAITDIVYAVGNGTAVATGLPAGVTGTSDSSGVFTISGTPTVSGSFPFTVSATGLCLPATSLTGTITVNPDTTLSLTTGGASQTVCVNNPIVSNVYAVTDATAVSATGLPAGLTESFVNGVYTFSGTPTVAGEYNYTVTTSGSCVQQSLSGTITVKPDTTIALTSASTTSAQTICENNAIANIVYSLGNGTGATASNLPTGVTGNYANGVYTISGTPSAPGTYNYTVTTLGACVQATSTGTIIVNPTTTLAYTSGSTTQTLCINTPISNIVYAIGNGTGGSVSGLPAGVSGNYVGGVYTISGSPSVSGSFPYTVSAIGDCASATLTGTLTVNASTAIATQPASQSACPRSSVTFTTTATGTNLTYQWYYNGVAIANETNATFTIGFVTPTDAGNYTVAVNGSCGSVVTSNQAVLTVQSVAAPTGTSVQNTVQGALLSSIVVSGLTGSTITWYASLADAQAGTPALSPSLVLPLGTTTYFATQTVNGCESYETFAVTMSVALGTKGFDLAALVYYPNPVTEMFNISYKNDIESIEVYNIVGQRILLVKPNMLSTQIDMSALPSGTYMMNVKADGASKVIKVVKK
jgi:hypothetical protein